MRTALHWAVLFSTPRVVEQLIRLGVIAELQDYDGKDALQLARDNNEKETVQLLIEAATGTGVFKKNYKWLLSISIPVPFSLWLFQLALPCLSAAFPFVRLRCVYLWDMLCHCLPVLQVSNSGSLLFLLFAFLLLCVILRRLCIALGHKVTLKHAFLKIPNLRSVCEIAPRLISIIFINEIYTESFLFDWGRCCSARHLSWLHFPRVFLLLWLLVS